MKGKKTSSPPSGQQTVPGNVSLAAENLSL